MADSKLRIVIDANADGAKGELGAIAKDLKATGEAAKGASGDLGGMATATKSTGLSLTDLNSGLALARQAYQAVEGAIKAVIDPTVEYAKQVRDLSRTIGATAEESSMLIQAADDMQVSYGSLTGALEAAIRKGISPTIEGLGALADEYNTLAPGIERTKFLMDNFGRSGADLAPLMEQGAKGIDALGKSARNSGLIMDKEGVTAARNYEKATDDLGDAFHGLTYSIAGEALPALTDWMNKAAAAVNVQNLLTVAIKNGAISEQDAADIEAARAHGFFTVASEAEYLTGKIDKLDAEVANSRHMWELAFPPIEHVSRSTQDAGDAMDNAGKAAHGATGKIHELRGAVVDLSDTSAALAAGLSGTIMHAQEDYQSTIAETTPEIARLTGEIAKYQASQGQTFTVTKDATTSAAEYELATIKAAEALQKFTDYTDGDRGKQLELQVAADRAQESVVKLGEGFGYSKDFTVDHTKALAADQVALDAQIAKNAAAVEQFDKTTASFILQQTAFLAGPDASLAAAHALGILSDADYNLALNVRQMTKDWDLDKDGMVEAGAEADGLANALASQKTVVEQAAGVIPPLTEHIGALGGQSEAAKAKIDALNEGINNLHDKNISVHVRAYIDPALGDVGIDNWVAPPGNGGGGGSSTPPPIADPPGSGGGPQFQTGGRSGGSVVINNIINDGLAMSLEHARQRQIISAGLDALM